MKLCYLTFDDGITPYTCEILDILNKHNIKACFFVIGNCNSKREISDQDIKIAINRIVKEGHILGNHSYTHKKFTKLNKIQIRDEIIKTNEYLYKNLDVDYKIDYFRPPFGSYNIETLQEVKKYIPNILLWNLNSSDAHEWVIGEGIPPMKDIIRKKDIKICNHPYLKKCVRIYKKVVNNNERIKVILFHDTHNTTVDMLENIILKQLKNGYNITTPDKNDKKLKKMGIIL